ncbi:hypothetical protein M2368_002591 [Arthrobacter sp. JUb119]|uniref:hypothetical protein n=2 Tax=Glutamicibacter sp. TaxID=1931995 RepID=UPI000FB44DE4|nr:hypothetical protein [Arthrobacter sp. JUb119]
MNSSMDESESRTVRMFPDHADTVLWFPDPVPYDAAGLSPELAADLAGWEELFYEGLDRDYEWNSAELGREFYAQGLLLAQRVADELGNKFIIDLSAQDDDCPARSFQASGTAQNPQAAEAFEAFVVENNRFQADVAEARERALRGEHPGWYAYAPLSQTVFDPQNPERK